MDNAECTTPPSRRACAWCTPPGSPGAEMVTSWGICDRHRHEVMLVEPLEFAAARLRAPDIMGRAGRLELAEAIQRVLVRLERLRMPPGER